MKVSNPFTRLLLVSAGISSEHEKLIGSRERARHLSAGAAVLLTAILAFMSGGYALFTIFESQYVAVGLGILFATAIYNLDRSLVLSLESETSRKWPQLSLRIGLAVVIALLVSRPVELRLFAPEIERHIDLGLQQERKEVLGDAQAAEKEIRSSSESFVVEIEKRSNSRESKVRHKAKQTSYELCEKRLAELDDAVRMERDGTGGTRTVGCGPQCESKQKRADEQRSKCGRLASDIVSSDAALRNEDEALLAQIGETKNSEKEALETLQRRTETKLAGLTKIRRDSFLSRHKALAELAADDESVALVVKVVTALFLLFEIAPLAVKLMTPAGTHSSVDDAEKVRVESALRLVQAAVTKAAAATAASEALEKRRLDDIAAEGAVHETIRRTKLGRFTAEAEKLISSWVMGAENSNEHHQDMDRQFKSAWANALDGETRLPLSRSLRQRFRARAVVAREWADRTTTSLTRIITDRVRIMVIVGSAASVAGCQLVGSMPPDVSIGVGSFILTAGEIFANSRRRDARGIYGPTD